MSGVLVFMSQWGMFILFVGGGALAMIAIIASLHYERKKRRTYVQRNFGREVSDAEKRQLERAL